MMQVVEGSFTPLPDAVGEIVAPDPVHGCWHFAPVIGWQQLGAGAKLYTAEQMCAFAKEVASKAQVAKPWSEMETMKRLELANAQLSQQVQMLKRTASGPELLERLAASQVPLGTEFSDVLKKNLWNLYATDAQWAEIHKDLAEKTLAQVREILKDSTIPHVAARVCRALEKIDLIIPSGTSAEKG